MPSATLQRPRIGAQRPRLEHVPPYTESRYGEVIDLAALAGLFLDEWQENILEAACAIRPDDRWTCFEVGYEVPRQNGKTAAVEARILAGLFIFAEERTIIYSAHEFKTSHQTFLRIEKLINGNRTLSRKVRRISRAADDKSIELIDGSIVRFMTRSGGSGRGFTGDLIILDEAYNISAEMIAAIMPTMAARSMDGNPQIWYLSSAGTISSDVLNGIRARGLEAQSPRLMWMEWSCPDDVDSEDPEAFYMSNPGAGIRISLEFFFDELDGFRSDPEKGEDKWRRERLGIREKLSTETVIDPKKWAACLDEDSFIPDGARLAFAIDVPPERDAAWIAVAAELPGARVHFELIDAREGISWVPERLSQLRERWNPVRIIVDAKGAAASLLPDIRAFKVPTRQLSVQDLGNASARMFDLIDQGMARHTGEPQLTAAVENAKTKNLGDAGLWKWDRRNAVAQISPLVASTLALHGLTGKRSLGNAEPRKPRRLHIG